MEGDAIWQFIEEVSGFNTEFEVSYLYHNAMVILTSNLHK